MGRPRRQLCDATHIEFETGSKSGGNASDASSPNALTEMDGSFLPWSELYAEAPRRDADRSSFIQSFETPNLSPSTTSTNRQTYQFSDAPDLQNTVPSEASIQPSVSYWLDHQTHPVQWPTTDIDLDSSKVSEEKSNSFVMELSYIQSSLHRQRDRLPIIDTNVANISHIQGLECIIQITSTVCAISHSMFHGEPSLGASTSALSVGISRGHVNAAPILLTLTIVLEILKLYEALVRIAHKDKETGVLFESHGATEIQIETSSPDPCTFFVNCDLGEAATSSLSTRSSLGLLACRAKLRQILILTVMDLQLASFERLFVTLTNQAIGAKLGVSLTEAQLKTKQLKRDLKSALELSQNPWNLTL